MSVSVSEPAGEVIDFHKGVDSAYWSFGICRSASASSISSHVTSENHGIINEKRLRLINKAYRGSENRTQFDLIRWKSLLATPSLMAIVSDVSLDGWRTFP